MLGFLGLCLCFLARAEPLMANSRPSAHAITRTALSTRRVPPTAPFIRFFLSSPRCWFARVRPNRAPDCGADPIPDVTSLLSPGPPSHDYNPGRLDRPFDPPQG